MNTKQLDLAQFEGHTPMTALPWRFQGTRKPAMPLVGADGSWIASPYNRVGDIEDFEYIAWSANNYPALLAECRRQREQIKVLREALRISAGTLGALGGPTVQERQFAELKARAALKATE